MQSNFITHNVNSADVMPMWSTPVVNPDDVMHSMHDMHVQVSQASLHNIDAPHYAYWPGMCAC